MREGAMPSRPDAVRYGEARDRDGRGQARAGACLAALASCLLLGACVGSPGESPFEFYRQVTGEALEGRPMPPGLDRARPNLGTVPQRPAKGPAAERAELSDLLAANRAAAASPMQPGAPVPDRPATEGLASVPAAPPEPARLAPAPAIGAGPATLLLPGTEAPTMPEAAPAAPPPEMNIPAPPNLAAPPSFPPIAPRGL
jgi:hypothetical protein